MANSNEFHTRWCRGCYNHFTSDGRAILIKTPHGVGAWPPITRATTRKQPGRRYGPAPK